MYYCLLKRGRGLNLPSVIFLDSDPVFGARITKLSEVSTFGKVLSMLEAFLVWWPFWPLFGQKTSIFYQKVAPILISQWIFWPLIDVKMAILAT